jgi:hypothetical protein
VPSSEFKIQHENEEKKIHSRKGPQGKEGNQYLRVGKQTSCEDIRRNTVLLIPSFGLRITHFRLLISRTKEQICII